jgi:hydrogenase maturation protein HypF
MGRLFDAVASFLGIRNEVSYEAQAAIEMEVLSKPFVSNAKPYPYKIEQTENGTMIRLRELLSAVVQDVRANVSVGMIGARFHQTIAEVAIDICRRVHAMTNLNEVALSGGVWQNQILLDLVRDGLRKADFVVYVHQQVPSNDGGLAAWHWDRLSLRIFKRRTAKSTKNAKKNF